MRKLFVVVCINLFLSINLIYSFDITSSFVIDRRIDHNGGTEGYYVGDVALLGSRAYNMLWRGGHAYNIGSQDGYIVIDRGSADIVYLINNSVKRYKGTLVDPYSIAVLPNGQTFVGDMSKNEIQRLGFSGGSMVFQKSINFLCPIDIYKDSFNYLYLVNPYEKLVYIYTTELVQKCNPIPIQSYPLSVCANYSSIFVLTKDAIEQYTQSGTFIGKIELQAGIQPLDIEIDWYGNLYVLDGNGYIHKYRDNAYVCTVLGPGTGDYKIQSPNGITLNIPTGMIAVYDDVGLKMYKIATAIFNIKTEYGYCVSEANLTNKFTYSLAMDSYMTIKVVNSQNQTVKVLAQETWNTAGQHTILWDGKDNNNNYLPVGSYRLRITADERCSAFEVETADYSFTIKKGPELAITSLISKVINASNPIVYLKYNLSESMNVYYAVSGNGNTYSEYYGDYAGENNRLFFNFAGLNYPEGEYLLTLTGRNTAGFSTSDLTNIYVNYYPLRMSVRQPANGLNPLVNNICYEIFLSEPANVVVKLEEQNYIICSKKMPAGTNHIFWNGRDGDNKVFDDGVYYLSVRSYQANIDSVETNRIKLIIDTKNPVVNIVPSCEYISPSETSSIGILDSVNFSVSVDEETDIEVVIADKILSEIRGVYTGHVLSNQTLALSWDGKTNGISIPDGEYYIKVTALDEISNKSDAYSLFAIDNNNSIESGTDDASVNRLLTLDDNYMTLFYWSRLENKYIISRQESYGGSTTRCLWSVYDANSLSVSNTYAFIDSQELSSFGSIYLSQEDKYFGYFAPTYQNGPADIRIYDLSDNSVSPYYSQGSYYSIYDSPILPWLNAGADPSVFYTFYDNNYTNIIIKTLAISGDDITVSQYKSAEKYIINGTLSKSVINSDNKYILITLYDDQAYQTLVYNTIAGTIVGRYNFYYKFIQWLNTYEYYGINKTGQLSRINLQNGLRYTITNLLNLTNGFGDVSFDKKKVLTINNTGDIFVYDMRRKCLKQYSIDSMTIRNYYNLASQSYREYPIYFSLDGSYALFHGSVSNQWGIFRIDFNDSPPANLTAEIDYPSVGIPEVSGVLSIKGTAEDGNFDKYLLLYRLAGSTSFMTNKVSTHPVNRDVLGAIDTLNISGGEGNNLIIKLIAYDKAGNVRTAVTTNKIVNTSSRLLSALSVTKDYVPYGGGGAQVCFRINTGTPVLIKLIDELGMQSTVYYTSGSFINPGYYHVSIGNNINTLHDGRITCIAYASPPWTKETNIIYFTYDKTAPAVVLTTPTEVTLASSSINIEGTISDTNFSYYEVIVDGETTNRYTSPANGLIATVSTGESKDYTVVIEAYDKAGNKTTRSISIHNDRNPPVVTITSPLSGDIIRYELLVEGTICDSDIEKYEIYLDDTKLYTGYTEFYGNVGFDVETYQGDYTAVVKAYDEAGNITTKTIPVSIDNNPPVTSLLVGGNSLTNIVYRENGTNFISGDIYIDLAASSGDTYSVVAATYVSIDGGSFGTSNNIHFSEGFHTLAYYSVDNLENTEAVKTYSLCVDNDSPVVQYTVQQPFYYYNTNMYVPLNNKVRFDSYDAISGVDGIYYSIDNGGSYTIYRPQSSDGLQIFRNGLCEIYYFAVDNVGNTSATNVMKLFIDPVYPFSQLVWNEPVFKNLTYVYYKNLLSGYLSVFDYGAGVWRSYLKIDNGSYSLNTNLLFNASISNRISFYSIDYVSNIEPVQTYYLLKDNQAPDVSLQIGGNVVTNVYVYLLPGATATIDSVDSGCGLLSVQYSLNGEEYVVYTNTFALSQTTNLIRYYAMDHLSNQSVLKEALYMIDGEAPQTALYLVGGKTNFYSGNNYCSAGSVFGISAYDAGSGLSNIYVRVNEVLQASNLVTILSNGSYDISYYAVDRLGNTEDMRSYSVRAPLPDSNPPQVSMSFVGNTYTNSSIVYGNQQLRISIHAEDIGLEGEVASGVNRLFYSMDGEWNFISSNSVTLSLSAGSHIVKAYADDITGNVSETNAANITIDNMPPVSVCDYGYTGWTNTSILAAITAQDYPLSGASGILEKTILFDGSVFEYDSVPVVIEGIHTIEFYSIDNVGNQETNNTQIVKIDFQAPAISISGVQDYQIYGRAGVSPVITIGENASGSGIGYVRVRATCNNALLYSYEDTSNVYNICLSNMRFTNEGDYLLTVEAKDNANNISMASCRFSIDVSPPDNPFNIRHLFDGRNVYLQWDQGSWSDLERFVIYKDNVLIGTSTNTIFKDSYNDGSIHYYSVSAIDRVGNESVRTVYETVNTAPYLEILHPETNEFYRSRLWFWAINNHNTQVDDEDFTINFINNQTNEDFVFQGFNQIVNMIHEHDNRNNRGNNSGFRISDLVVDAAVSNMLVPTNFFVLYQKNQVRKNIIENIDLREYVDGIYTLRISGDIGAQARIEDFTWFGVDNTEPVTYLVVNSNVIVSQERYSTVNVPSGSTLFLSAEDPVVNGVASGVCKTYFQISGRNYPVRWSEYDNRPFVLPDGVYLLFVQSWDNAHFMHSELPFGNREDMKIIQVNVGNYTQPHGGHYGHHGHREIRISGANHREVYRQPVFLNFNASDYFECHAELDGNRVNCPVNVGDRGDHVFRVTTTDDCGSITVREITFRIE